MGEGDYRTAGGHNTDHVDNTVVTTSNDPETKRHTNEDKPDNNQYANDPWQGYSGQQYSEGYSVSNTATEPIANNYGIDTNTHVQANTGQDQQWNRQSSAGFNYDRAQATPTMDPNDNISPPVAEQDNEGNGEEEKTDKKKGRFKCHM